MKKFAVLLALLMALSGFGQTHTISGYITGKSINTYSYENDVYLTFSNPGGGVDTASGNVTGHGKPYSKILAIGWHGTCTPSKTGYIFSPINRTYTTLGQDFLTDDYTATDTLSPTVYIYGPLSGNTFLVNSIDTIKTRVLDNSGVTIKRVYLLSTDNGSTYSKLGDTVRCSNVVDSNACDTLHVSIKFTFTPTIVSTQCRKQVKMYDGDGNVGTATSGVFSVYSVGVLPVAKTMSMQAPIVLKIYNIMGQRLKPGNMSRATAGIYFQMDKKIKGYWKE